MHRAAEIVLALVEQHRVQILTGYLQQSGRVLAQRGVRQVLRVEVLEVGAEILGARRRKRGLLVRALLHVGVQQRHGEHGADDERVRVHPDLVAPDNEGPDVFVGGVDVLQHLPHSLLERWDGRRGLGVRVVGPLVEVQVPRGGGLHVRAVYEPLVGADEPHGEPRLDRVTDERRPHFGGDVDGHLFGLAVVVRHGCEVLHSPHFREPPGGLGDGHVPRGA